jgi:hypothetical protein
LPFLDKKSGHYALFYAYHGILKGLKNCMILIDF